MESKIKPVVIDRINTLQKGDKFLYSALWRRVTSVREGKVKYTNCTEAQGIGVLSANSKLFVEIERKETKPENK
jgi:hypothetical protein